MAGTGGIGLLCLLLLLALPQTTLAKTRVRTKQKTVAGRVPSRAKTKQAKTNQASKHAKRSRHSHNWKRHGQQAVDGRRTEQIQDALIQSHYLDGEPSGAWDAKTQEALRRYQAANGWQSKVVPDSRALIKLGLGPSTDKLLNPDSAMTSRIEATSTAAGSARANPNPQRP